MRQLHENFRTRRLKVKLIHFVMSLASFGSYSFAFTQTHDSKGVDTSKKQFYSATAYFSRTGQKEIVVRRFYNSDLVQMCKEIDSASNGAIVTIDDVRYSAKNGKVRWIEKIPYNFNEGKVFIPYKSPDQLAFEKVKFFNFRSGIIHFSGEGFPSVMAINVKEKSLLAKCLAACVRGSIIIFDNCSYKDQSGVLSKLNKALRL